MDDILKAIQSGDIQAGINYFDTLSATDRKAFIEQVGSFKSDSAARFLTALHPTVEQKDLKKLIKKTLFLLKTQGIHVDEPATAGESVLKRVEVVKEQIAFASNYDDEATRALLLAFEVRKKQFIFTHATQRFGEGLVEMMSAPLDKQGLDDLLGDYRSRTRRPTVLVEISPPYALYLIEEASRQSGKRTDEIRGLKRLATALTGDVRIPSDIYRLELPSPVPETSWNDVVTQAIFEPFKLSWKGMEEDRKEYESIVHPQIVLPPHIVEEKKIAYFKELVASDRIKSLRPAMSRMLEDYAYLFCRQGEYANYAALLKTLESAQMFDAVMQFFVGKSFEQRQKEEEQQQQQQSGLIVNPYTQKR